MNDRPSQLEALQGSTGNGAPCLLGKAQPWHRDSVPSPWLPAPFLLLSPPLPGPRGEKTVLLSQQERPWVPHAHSQQPTASLVPTVHSQLPHPQRVLQAHSPTWGPQLPTRPALGDRLTGSWPVPCWVFSEPQLPLTALLTPGDCVCAPALLPLPRPTCNPSHSGFSGD